MLSSLSRGLIHLWSHSSLYSNVIFSVKLPWPLYLKLQVPSTFSTCLNTTWLLCLIYFSSSELITICSDTFITFLSCLLLSSLLCYKLHLEIFIFFSTIKSSVPNTVPGTEETFNINESKDRYVQQPGLQMFKKVFFKSQSFFRSLSLNKHLLYYKFCYES